MVEPDGPGLLLAPHPDDAVLSAWSTLRAPGDVTVVDVCARPPAEGVLGEFDPVFGVTDSAALVRERLSEDRAALARAGREPVHLDLLDAQYRDAELSIATVRAAIEEAVPAASWICAPAGIGAHPDHIVVRESALAIARDSSIPVTLYADLPYAVQWGWPSWVTNAAPRPHLVPDARWRHDLRDASIDYDELVPEVHPLTPTESTAKLDALQLYRTQFAALNAGPLDRLRHPEIIRFEVHWRVPHAT